MLIIGFFRSLDECFQFPKIVRQHGHELDAVANLRITCGNDGQCYDYCLPDSHADFDRCPNLKRKYRLHITSAQADITGFAAKWCATIVWHYFNRDVDFETWILASFICHDGHLDSRAGKCVQNEVQAL